MIRWEEIALENMTEKQQALAKVRDILEPFGDFIAVVEGVSISNVMHDGIIRELRRKLVQYEIENDRDPSHDWSDEVDCVTEEKNISTLKRSVIRIMNQISEESMKKVVDYIRFMQYEEECEATREIMSMPEMVEAIDKYRNNFNESDFVDWDDVKDDV